MILDASPAVPPARHDLLAVDAADWPAVVATRPRELALSPAATALVRDWGDAGWPVIARRSSPGDRADCVPVGLPLPPSCDKVRIPLAIPPGLHWRHVAPVTLVEAASVAPVPWGDTIADLIRLAQPLGLEPRVFGALLWQAVTGMVYLGPASDIDLLWPVDDADALGPLLDGLERIAAVAPIRIDGEVITGVGGVQWRELAEARRGGSEVVLSKVLDRASFVPASAILRSAVVSCH